MKTMVAIMLAIAAMSCSKSNSTGNDDQPPAVIITTPAAHQQFNAGQTVAITGTVTDNKKLAELHVHISNLVTGALLVDIHRYPTTSSYALNETFQVQAGIFYRIQVIAKDNSANEGRASVEISTN
ncbi:MAG: Ig-like domain-containing protein [Chitinophagaceae bacterium]